MTTAPVWPDGICSRRAICGVTVLSVRPKLPAPCSSGCRLVVLLRAAAAGVLLGLEIELVDGDVQRLLLLVAQHLHRHLVPGLVAITIFTQLVAVRDRPAVELRR